MSPYGTVDTFVRKVSGNFFCYILGSAATFSSNTTKPFSNEVVLSELIRTAFVPKPGCRFYVADFPAIEARVIAWIAGKHWRQEVFANGGDIYCASASQMFHVPVEKHGVNGHLRQKGKIAELALGYGGSVCALKAMGTLNYGLQEEELKPLVDAWRLSNSYITKLWWAVDKAAATCVRERTATETHGIRRTRFEPASRRFHADMVRSYMVAGTLSTDKCPSVAARATIRYRGH